MGDNTSEQSASNIDHPESSSPRADGHEDILQSYSEKCKQGRYYYYQKAGAALKQILARRPDVNQSLALATWALAAFALWALLDSRDALEHGQRAWLSPVAAIVDPNTPLGKAAILKFQIIYANTGREPALSFNDKGSESGTVPLPQNWQSDDWSSFSLGENRTCESIQPLNDGPVIYPAQSAFDPP